MLVGSDDDILLSRRILDFLAVQAPWQRRLWRLGPVLILLELLEAHDACAHGVLHEKAVQFLTGEARARLREDPGIGDHASPLQACLSKDLGPDGAGAGELTLLVASLASKYLDRWADHLAKPDPTSIEFASRSIAAHLLDLGYHPAYLHRWWTFRVKHEQGQQSLQEIVRATVDLADAQPRSRDVLVPFLTAPGPTTSATGTDADTQWLAPDATRGWLKRNKLSIPKDLRYAGALRVVVDALDPWAASDKARVIVDRVLARVQLSTSSIGEAAALAYVAGHDAQIDLLPSRRFVEVQALRSEGMVYRDPGSRVDAALELMQPLETGPVAPAVAGSWAAIESLLTSPADKGNRAIAGDRLAALVACSWPRAELTTLAYRYAKENSDALAKRISDADSNQNRSAELWRAIRDDGVNPFGRPEDQAALRRMQAISANPAAIRRVREYVTQTFRRLYRCRNLILHWGNTRAVAVEATLRTAPALVGAGMDRLAHHWFRYGTEPVELAGRAEFALDSLGTSFAKGIVELLD